MIKSMTGFGRCEAADEERKFTVEMKGVNHRYLDANIRMPKKLNFFRKCHSKPFKWKVFIVERWTSLLHMKTFQRVRSL